MPDALPDSAAADEGQPAGTETQDAGETSGGSGAYVRKRFSKDFPYRRVKMNPEPGIRAEAAGILIWPVPASPLFRQSEE